MRFYIDNTKVCTRMELHGENVRLILLENGWEEVSNRGEADCVFVNTCAFIKKARDISLDKIRIACKKENIVVLGCLPEIDRRALDKVHQGKSYGGYDIRPLIKDFGLMASQRIVGARLNNERKAGNTLVKSLNLLIRNPYLTYLYDKRSVYHLWISQGCRGECTYCADPARTMRTTSHRVCDVVNEFRCALHQGYRLFSLNADDTSAFGIDNGENLSMLLESMLQVTGNYRIIVTECNPAVFAVQPSIKEILKSPRFALINAPIQSGSSRIVQLMARKYDPHKVLETLEEIRSANRRLLINTHMIVGFPGETEVDFALTEGLLQRFAFNRVKIFTYSEMPNTKASSLPDKVDESVKMLRRNHLKRLIAIQTIRSFSISKYIVNFTR